MGRGFVVKNRIGLYFILLAGLLVTGPAVSLAADTVCARVKIEIKQELTLERQAFDAHMRITNGLANITLENVKVEVSFADEDGDAVTASPDAANTAALFFIRLDKDALENIDDVDGTGTVGASSTADIHWLIIPAPGSSNGLEKGTLYYVGAKLTYTIGGEQKVTEVTPDYIFVKPMPEITLDYFLPADVYGDDAFTPQTIEPPIPFSLGVRVKNSGYGVARKLKIDSAQPKITENEQRLLIGFAIEGSEVNGQPVTDSLLVDFGDISPNSSGMARWIMTCTLSGKFVSFTADFSHSDELGGELTSLIKAVNTHFLVQDVIVDLPGRDAVRDFLANDGSVYRIYESQVTGSADDEDPEVIDQSAASTLQMFSNSGQLTTPVTAGFMYVGLNDPFGGQKVLQEVIRSDGKVIKAENAWLSKTRDGLLNWHYFINLFDVNSSGSYTVKFSDPSAQPQPPVLLFIPDRSAAEQKQISFIVEATDPNGTFPLLSANPLPAGVLFEDRGDGLAVFDWTPARGQAGRYAITFKASDGVLQDLQLATILINPENDSDGDGMDDDWERDYFGGLQRDGSGDFDGDGILDLDEYLYQSDPTVSNAPSVPVISFPADGTEVTASTPWLKIENSLDPDQDPITYEFEVYSDESMGHRVAGQPDVLEAQPQTAWRVSQVLSDNSWYYWRVRATDGYGYSQWAYGRFFVNTENDAPGAFYVSSPAADSTVDTLTPSLTVSNAVDIDLDAITYAYYIYADSNLSTLVSSVTGLEAGGEGSTAWALEPALQDNTWYFWHAVATDEHGASAQTTLVSFFINTASNAPTGGQIVAPAIGSEVVVTELDLVVTNATDADGDALTYFFEIDTVAAFDSGSASNSGPQSEGQTNTSWHVSGLSDNSEYFWRVKATDGVAHSEWALGSFFVNTVNDPPSTPVLKNPGDGAWVETLTPSLQLHPATDVDRDQLSYRFELYRDDALTQAVAAAEADLLQWVAPTELDENRHFYWRAQAIDEHGTASGWMATASFFVNNNGVDDPPAITLVEPGQDLLTNGQSVILQWADSDPDSDAAVALYYDSDAAGRDGTLIVSDLSEDADGDGDTYQWDISALADGIYYIYGDISDDIASDAGYAPGAITVDRSAPVVAADPPGGIDSTPVTVTLSAIEPATIYYTLDESEPSGASAVYEGPLDISETTTVKFMAIDTAGNQSQTVVEIYTIEAAANLAPVADAGEDINAPPGDLADLDGSLSDDADSGPLPLAFSWRFAEIPADSALTDADIIDGDSPYASFVPDVPGSYQLELSVDDGQDADWDMVTVTCVADHPGDLDGDGDVDYDDYLIFTTAYRSCAGDANFIEGADLDGDGCVTINDYRILRTLVTG